MNLSRNALAPILGLAFAVSALVACSAPDADTAVTAAQEPAAADAVTESTPSDAATAPEPAPEVAEAAPAPVDLPTGPEMDMVRDMVGMSAALFALDQACAPGRADEAAMRKVARQVPGRQQLGLSDAQMDALFDAEYASSKQKLDALSDAEIAARCKEIEEQAAAAGQALGQ